MSSPIDLEKAGESSADLQMYPIEVEQIRHLQRQAKQSGLKTEKLKAEQEARNEYNNTLADKDTSIYSNVIPPMGSVVVKLYKKPIFELNGFLKPDLRKVKSDAGQVSYEENRFPYLEVGVVVAHSGLEKQFPVKDESKLIGSVVSLKVNTRLDKYVYFVDKTEITPTYFEGYIVIPAYELETVLALSGDKHFNDIVAIATGKVGNSKLQTKLNNSNEIDSTKKS